MTKNDFLILAGIFVLIFILYGLVNFVNVNIIGINHPFPTEPADVLYGKTRIPVTIYSLNSELEYKYPFSEGMILGKINLSATESSEALSPSITFIKPKNTARIESTLCFFPRHAIEFELSGNKYMFVVCYQCHIFHACCNGEPLKSTIRNEQDLEWFFEGSPQKLNALLEAAKIPRDKSGDRG